MRHFSHIAEITEPVKCHYPGCYQMATTVMHGTMFTLLLCDEHAATERYIASIENSPQREGNDVYVVFGDDGDTPEVD